MPVVPKQLGRCLSAIRGAPTGAKMAMAGFLTNMYFRDWPTIGGRS